MEVLDCKLIVDEAFCRLCFTREGFFRRIQNTDAEQQEDTTEILQLVEKHLHVEIFEQNYQVCEECCQQLFTFGNFYTRVHQQIDKFLIELHLNVKNLKAENEENCDQEVQDNLIDPIDPLTSYEDTSEDTEGRTTEEIKEDINTVISVEKEELILFPGELAAQEEQPATQKPRRSCRKKKDPSEPPTSAAKISKKDKKRKMLATEEPKKKSAPREDKFSEFDFREDDNDSDEHSNEPIAEEWPGCAPIILDDFPNPIIENGLLKVKGKELMVLINKFYSMECNLCDKTKFTTLTDLIQHYFNIHNEKGYVMCCSTQFKTYPAIIMHMARHIQPDAFKCNICGYMVTRPRFLEIHKKTHLPDEEKPFACDHCPRRFCWKTACQVHQLTHQIDEPKKKFICPICGNTYNTPGGLCTHKKRVHTDTKIEPHVCHVCAKKFATRTGLNEHMATIHQPRERGQLQCRECGKWLMNSRCLKSHMILHSTETFSCSTCDYTTKKKSLLLRHNLTQHSDEKPFSCTICSRAFKLKRALTVHMAQHESTKQHKCNFCDRIFNSSTNFYTHRKAAHPDELNALKLAKLEEQRQKRIAAGVEDPLVAEDQSNQLVILPTSSIDNPVDFTTFNPQVHQTYHLIDQEGTITILQENLATDGMI